LISFGAMTNGSPEQAMRFATTGENETPEIGVATVD
jgi:hypothetical protein